MDMQKGLSALKIRGARGKKRLRELLSAPAVRSLLSAILGAVFARASFVEGMTPLGLSYCAASGRPLAAALGVFISALSIKDGLVYAACAAVIYACRMVFRDTAAARRGLIMPLCATAALLCTKSVVAVTAGFRGIVLLLCESLLCGGFACLLAQARRTSAPYALWGRIAAAGGLLLALWPLMPFGFLSPARAGGFMIVLLSACCGGPAVGAAVGVAFGAAFDLAGGQGLFFAATYCFSGLLSGFCAHKRRYAAAVCGVIANAVSTLWLINIPFSAQGIYEAFLAACVMSVLPEGVIADVDAAFSNRTSKVHAPAGSLNAVSRAIGALGAAMEGLWEEEPSDNPADCIRKTADRVCLRCAARERCWVSDYNATLSSLQKLLPLLDERPGVTPDCLPPPLAGACLHPRRLCGALTDEHMNALRRKAAARRDQEARSNMSRQYFGLQAALRELDKPEISQEIHPGIESRVKKMARAYAPRVQAAVWSRDGQMHIDLTAPDGTDPLPDSDAFLRSLSRALDRDFLPPASIETARGRTVRISQRARMSLTLSCAARPADGERVCGDVTTQLRTADGRAVVMLSDGMGTGEPARAAAEKALGLLSGFAKAGCGLAESAAAVLPALTARFPDWGFVTLDLLEVNLFSGKTQILKYGAAAGYILRDAEIRAVPPAALPAGLAEDEALRPETFRLCPGDRVLILSDGITEAMDVESFLREKNALPPQKLCSELIRIAVESGGKDDMTALVAQIFETTA